MELKDAFDIVERTAGWLLPAVGVAVAARKRIRSIVRAALLADSFHDHFGADAAEAIKTILDGVARSQSVNELRSRIQERHLRVGIYVCGEDGRCTWCNEWLAESFGRDRSDMLGYGWLKSIDTTYQQQAVEKWQFSVKNGTPYTDEYTVVNTRSGKTWQACTEAFSLTMDGIVVAFVGYVAQKKSGAPGSDVAHAQME